MNAMVKQTALVFTLALSLVSAPAIADGQPGLTLNQERLNGPRLGVSYVVQHDKLDRDGTFKRRLQEADMDVLISQFGWHFEWLVAPETGGPAFVTEVLPFVGGVEYGKIIPSVSLVLGIRMPQGFEFGMGPNVLTTFDPDDPVNTSLVLAAGQSVRFGDVRIPLNLALLTNKGGNRVCFVFGYAMPEIRRKKSRENTW
ncbi:MAG: hypothetical protein GF418_10695 [Chitinivibrionales bacterium]|nr:hypothetical protein [Chitinivibrionales bacterium]MBD3396082.1 hypothetical protein [Chitinivibrionales bacterium]